MRFGAGHSVEQLAYVGLAAEDAWRRDSIGVTGEMRRTGHCAPQHFGHDIAWHLGHGTMITSASASPDMLERGVSSGLRVDGEHGRWLHVWDARTRTRKQAIDLGGEQRMVPRLQSAHNPTRAYGFASVMFSLVDLSASVFLWYLGRDAGGGLGEWKARRVVTIHARPADPSRLPSLLRELRVVPPLITDISLSPDDQSLYVSCWGTGELRRYDVADPFNPSSPGWFGLAGSLGARRTRGHQTCRATAALR